MASAPILIISGTNRPNSNAMRVADLVRGHYERGGIEVGSYSLTEMPREIFDATSYVNKPASWSAVQKRVLDAGGLHIITPEYNGSFPGVLKYFIDMLKFPESFDRKPAAFVGEAAGTWGALRAVEQLQHIFGYRSAYLYPERVFIPEVRNKFDAEGKFLDAPIDERLGKQALGFAEFVGRLK